MTLVYTGKTEGFYKSKFWEFRAWNQVATKKDIIVAQVSTDRKHVCFYLVTPRRVLTITARPAEGEWVQENLANVLGEYFAQKFLTKSRPIQAVRKYTRGE